MKMLITFLIVAMNSIQVSHACQCYGPSFGDKEANEAAVNFMISKGGIAPNNIIKVNSEFVESYLTLRDKIVLKAIGALEPTGQDDGFGQCEYDCVRSQNEKFDTTVEYLRPNGKSCTQKLIVKLQGNYMSNGFKSIVIKQRKAICY